MTFDFKAALQRGMGSNFNSSVYDREQQGIAEYGNIHMFTILHSASDIDAGRTRTYRNGQEVLVKRTVIVGKEEVEEEERIRKEKAERLLERLYQLELIDTNYPKIPQIKRLCDSSLNKAHKYLDENFS